MIMSMRLRVSLLSTGIAVALMGIVALWYLEWGPSRQPVTINGTTVPPVPSLHPDRVAEGEKVYAQHCAACHGVNLEGAPNWRIRLADGSLAPPPHDSSGHTWHHSDGLLTRITAEGGQAVYGSVTSKSNMPAFGDKLTSQQIEAVLTFIKSKWNQDSREFQWWVSVTQPGE